MTRPATYDHLKSLKKPVTQRVPICCDSELADALALAQLDEAIKQDQAQGDPTNVALRRTWEDARAVVEDARDAAAEQTVTFVFRSLGRRKFEDLVDAHPATKRDKDEARDLGIDTPRFNAESFPIALIAASCIEPELTEDQVKEMFNSDDWNKAELVQLFDTALAVNNRFRVVDLGKDSTPTRSSGRSSTTASLEESPTPSS